MDNRQRNFNRLFKMLSLSQIQPELVTECILMKNSELTFNSNGKVEREHILNFYKIKYRLETEIRPDNHFVIGYADLLPHMEHSKLKYMNVSTIMTQKGGFLIFSDYEYTELVGILKSKRNLSEVRKIQKGYDHFYQSKIFINGILNE